jgi:hypothetical protein
MQSIENQLIVPDTHCPSSGYLLSAICYLLPAAEILNPNSL